MRSTIVSAVGALVLAGCESAHHNFAIVDRSAPVPVALPQTLAVEEVKVRALKVDLSAPHQLFVALDDEFFAPESGIWTIRVHYDQEQLPGESWRELKGKVIIVAYDRDSLLSFESFLQTALLTVRP